MRLLDRVVVVGGLLVLALLAGTLVAVSAPTGELAATPPPTLPPSEGRILDEGLVGSVMTLDPLYAGNSAERDISALLFSGLTRLGPDSRVVPDLAERWKISDAGKVYDFFLRQDARWHDGEPVTADDVIFTILTLQHPDYDGPSGGPWRGVEVERVGDYQLRFRLPTATAGFLLVASQPIVPSHLLTGIPVAERRLADFGRSPMGNGPFRLASLTPDEASLVPADVGEAPDSSLAPDPLASPGGPTPAAAPVRPRPQVDRLRFRFYETAEQAADAFRAGELDALGGLPASEAGALARLPGVRAERYPRSTMTAVMLNLRFEERAFRDPRVRRALLMAIDRDGLVADLVSGWASVADTPISPASFAYEKDAAGKVPFDPKAAQKLFQEAGWKVGRKGLIPPRDEKPILIEVAALPADVNPVAAGVARQVAAAWHRIGLQVRVKPYPRDRLIAEKLVPGHFQAAILDVNLGLDPDLFPLLASSQASTGGSNIPGYQSSDMDKLLADARLFADGPTRRERFQALQKELAQELPVLPLFFADYVYLLRDGVEGPATRQISTPSDRFWDVLTWRVADDTDE
jgi:peptide/nickel transport system substrate-binding protein